MKRMIFIVLILISFLIVTHNAMAGDRRPYSYRPSHPFSVYIGPPAVWVAPPFYFRSYSPSYRINPYDYDDYYRCGSYRVWVPGYWEERWTPYGWEKVWIPGYWRYEYY